MAKDNNYLYASKMMLQLLYEFWNNKHFFVICYGLFSPMQGLL